MFGRGSRQATAARVFRLYNEYNKIADLHERSEDHFFAWACSMVYSKRCPIAPWPS